MSQVAKLFINGRSQAVRLPLAYRFDTNEVSEVYIHKDPETGDVILSRRPPDWDSFFLALKRAGVSDDFLDEKGRKQTEQHRDPFEGWHE